jgi:hypothetical protein
MEKYKQCMLQKGRGNMVCWIPSWAAHTRNRVQLKDSDNPQEFWQITAVGELEIDESEVRNKGRNYKEFQGSTRGGGID